LTTILKEEEEEEEREMGHQINGWLNLYNLKIRTGQNA
jgi:hypothetical protein